MRQLKLAAIELLAAAVLVSCYWAGSIGKGGITLELPPIQAKQEGEVARVYLLADGLLFSTGGGVPFSAEVPMSFFPQDARVSIQGLPVGPRYQALVGTGFVSGGFFHVSYFGASTPFSISPNTDTSVVVSVDLPWEISNLLSGISFAWQLAGENLKGVVSTSSYTFAAGDSLIYAWDYSTGLILGEYDLAADIDGYGVRSYRINSLSNDPNYVFSYPALINSNIGILPFDYFVESWGFDPSLTAELGGSKNILESGGLSISESAYLFFRRADGIGGQYLGTWVDVDVPGVLDMVLSTNNAYFATEGGAFALPPDFLITPDLATQKVSFSAPGKILSLGFIPGGAAAPKIIMGTTNGAYASEITESPSISFGAASPITDFDGNSITDSITMVEVSPFSGGRHQAFMSRYWLYIYYDNFSYAAIYKLPFFAVIPGKATGLAWDNAGRLYVSGTEGMSIIDVGS